MVYLTELLVVMTVGLKIVRIDAQNVLRTWTHVLRQRRVSCISLGPGKQQCCVLNALVFCPVETQKNHLRTTCTCLTVTSKKESCRDNMPSSL